MKDYIDQNKPCNITDQYESISFKRLNNKIEFFKKIYIEQVD